MGNMSAQSEESKVFVEELCFDFAYEAASLWLARQKAVDAPHYTLTGLLEMDNRLETQIDALRVAGDPGREVSAAGFEGGLPEYFFAPAVLAFESCDETRISFLLEKAEKTPTASEAIIEALGWLTLEQALPHIKKLLAAADPVHQYIGMAASAFHRYDPGGFLQSAFYNDDLKLKARSLKAVGELGGRGDILMPGRLKDQQKAHDPASRFQAAWSSLLLGDTTSLEHLRTIVLDETSPFREEALQVSARKMNLKEALALHRELAKKADSQRLAVIGAGIIGNPALIPWLVKQMNIPTLARIAVQSFSFITGLNISKQQLEGTWPEGFEAGPNDDPTYDNVEPDPDENLPWPDAEKIALWWEKNKNQYPEETRLLLGKPITRDHLQHALQTGRQRQRNAAALELAILNPGKALYNTAAPAWRQIDQIRQIREGNKPRSRQPAANRVTPIVAATLATTVNYGKRELVITAANCITPVGLTAAQTAASVRAGIVRHRIEENYLDDEGNPVKAATIKGIVDNKQDVVDRIRAAAKKCLNDLLADYLENPRWRPSYVHFFMCVASFDRPGPDFAQQCRNDLLDVLGNKLAPSDTNVISQGHASLHYAIDEASGLIETNPDAVCVIGFIDSFHGEATLNWLESGGRLKSLSYGRHQGLIPSESVSFLIVEDLERVQREERPVLARITSLGLAEEPKSRSTDSSGTYSGLTEALHEALAPLKDRPVQAVLGDLNGEDERTREWGIAEMRCFRRDRQPRLWRPAFRCGDMGAASGGVMACIVSQGFQRNWLDSPALIFCSDDFGPCGAMILEKET
jgi:uncharacterized protein (TIGR02270 family)